MYAVRYYNIRLICGTSNSKKLDIYYTTNTNNIKRYTEGYVRKYVECV